ncbi:hypothetical protein C2G38_2188634 [Gigaspora rosea]|uniref:Uncharacterized protein n=1 Tax=Gigaspora rosea TaxID=44941 RepID=A0A397VAD9_9GLOM|nr:hypothetical protein C2G38_2188634 [Gigaspora rosea]
MNTLKDKLLNLEETNYEFEQDNIIVQEYVKKQLNNNIEQKQLEIQQFIEQKQLEIQQFIKQKQIKIQQFNQDLLETKNNEIEKENNIIKN